MEKKKTDLVVLAAGMGSRFGGCKQMASFGPHGETIIDYALYDGKFVRSIAAPDKDCTTDELAAALSEYIKLFDRLMKAYLAGKLDAHDVEASYYSYLINTSIHI